MMSGHLWCTYCGGSGFTAYDEAGNESRETLTCPACAGSGKGRPLPRRKCSETDATKRCAYHESGGPLSMRCGSDDYCGVRDIYHPKEKEQSDG